eukprot:4312870-Prymnesium_polylepis.1
MSGTTGGATGRNAGQPEGGTTPTTWKPRQMHSTTVVSGQSMALATAAKRPGLRPPAAWKTEAGMHAENRALA